MSAGPGSGGGGTGAGPGADWLALARRGIRLTEALARAGDGAGPRIATTPKDTIWRDGKITLARYRSAAERPLGPLLILQGLFGRQTIADLGPGRSLVERLLAAGVDLWVLDWGRPTRADRCNDMTDYAEFWLGDAIAAIRAETGAPGVALLGICQGGVFALCHAARHPDRVSGLALAATPVDFHADRGGPTGAGLLNLWVRNLGPELIGDALAERGNLPGALSGAVFEQLSPARGALKYGADLLALAEDGEALDTFLRMEAWLADRPDHPGAAARDWLIDLYCRNALAAGRFEIDGEPVDLGRVTCPVLNIVARDDHIVPPACCRALAGLTASRDYRELEVPTGHVGIFVSSRARETVPAAIAEFLAPVAGL